MVILRLSLCLLIIIFIDIFCLSLIGFQKRLQMRQMNRIVEYFALICIFIILAWNSGAMWVIKVIFLNGFACLISSKTLLFKLCFRRTLYAFWYRLWILESAAHWHHQGRHYFLVAWETAVLILVMLGWAITRAQVVFQTHGVLACKRLVGLTQLDFDARFFVTEAFNLILHLYFVIFQLSNPSNFSLCLPYIWLNRLAVLFLIEILCSTIEIIRWFLYIVKIRHNSFRFFFFSIFLFFFVLWVSALLRLYFKGFSVFISIFYTHLLRIDSWLLWNWNLVSIVFSKSHSFFCEWCTEILVLILSYFMHF